MSKSKKLLSIILCFLIVFSFSACSKDQSKEQNNKEKLSIVCTIFPEYDWVKSILGDKAADYELILLLDKGTDLHNYQPTVDDLAKISSCDMFVFVGGESDAWIEDALKNAENPNMITVNLLETLGSSVKEEEVIEGMQGEEEEEEEEAEEVEYDEHVWLSLKNASTICRELSEKIQKIDPENAEAYKANTEKYVASLDDLDKQYDDACKNAETKTLLFGDRFPFRYLVDDYGLNYYAAFVGCSAETEASFETIKFLADKTDELNLKTVMTIEGSDKKIAETIVKNTKDKNQNIAELNSMQGVTGKDVQNGATYLKIMEDNLKVLKDALK